MDVSERVVGGQFMLPDADSRTVTAPPHPFAPKFWPATRECIAQQYFRVNYGHD